MQKEKEARDSEAARIILEAEKFCANVNAPKGNDLNALDFGIDQQKEMDNLRLNDNDDNFFHVTCHVEPGLRAKIERGEFIDLECLLTKDTNFKVYDEKRIELVSRGGNTFFTSVSDREAKINGIRKWEQAFRIYAAIYTRANPHQASEVWEYVYVINTAASSFHWDNVAFYDSTFRQLMSQKPWRSWAKTYVQGWNLAMRDSIVRTQGNTNMKGKRDWRDDCCWHFNKNRCREGSNCHFDHIALTVAGGVMAISIVGKGRRHLEVEELLDTGAVIATSNTRTMVKNHLIIIILAVLGGIRDTRSKTIPDWRNVLHV